VRLRDRLRRRGRRELGRIVPRLREWEYAPEGWAADSEREGWNAEAVLAAYRAKLPVFRRVVAGTDPIAIPTSVVVRDSGPDVREQGSHLAFGYALALASRGSDRVSVLDWGGGLGFHFLIARALLPDEVAIDYHCKEVAGLCEAGRELVPEVVFHDDDSCLERGYDLVFASSSLQYSQDWERVLAGLAGAASPYLLVNRVPVARGQRSFVTRQRGHAYGLRTEYRSWVFDPDELVAAAGRAGADLVRGFLVGYRPHVHGAPAPVETGGFLFRAARRSAGIRSNDDAREADVSGRAPRPA
jgi:putative methyltransferase (TIGR04325 family)